MISKPLVVKINSKHIAFLLLFLLSVLLAACASSNYPNQKPQRHKKCDCPKWSLNNKSEKTEGLIYAL
jgi:predicted component of type VI protein secretion system